MDNQSSATAGNQSLVLSLILGVFSWLTPEHIDLGLKIATATGAITAAFFAARYHYYSTKVKKRQLKEMDEAEDE
jgi:hypothetical protein